MIPETVVLAFDPKTESRQVQKVFAHDLARTIWLAVKRSHLVSQYFDTSCLAHGKQIERMRRKGPLTAQQLFIILSWHPLSIIGSGELDFATELLPFINGEKTIKFEVNLSAQTEDEAFQSRLAGLGPGKRS